MPHSTKIRVRGYHCDYYGHVNNARYLEMLEEARWQYTETGMDLSYWEDRGLGFVVAAVNINFKRPASPGMDLEILTQTTKLEGRSGIIHQEIINSGNGKTVVVADITFAVIDMKTGRAVNMEGEVLAGFEKIREADQQRDGS